MPKSGQPTKKTDHRIEILLDALKDYMPFEKACDYAEVSKSTVYLWMQTDEELRIRVKHAKSVAVRGMIAELKKKDPKYWLNCMDGEDFPYQAPQVFENNYKLIVNVGDKTEDLSGRDRLNEEPEATGRLLIKS